MDTAASIVPDTVRDESERFLALVQPELPGSYKLAGLILGDAGEAEDAVCESVARAWQSRGRLRDPERFAAWFGRIVTNACRDRMRRRKGVRLLAMRDGMGGGNRDFDPFAAALARDEVGRLIRSLPPDQRIVLAMRYWRDMSLDEIANQLDVPVGTVKSRLYYAMKALRAELDRGAEVIR